MSNDGEFRGVGDGEALVPVIHYAGNETAPRTPAVEAAYRLAMQYAQAFGPEDVTDHCISCNVRSGVESVEAI